ncbi:AraC family transcriptional regulator [Fimbriimonas ginsengisoli]|uniref:Transcriptional regulator, AraC family protein n=1 Tax=Fimbriimonas ginsengisoli Gsoil 348 TaxID=661478 RepID=A0A068NYQ2_FIMGI|nr:AraC family transcriptional regulator [Fimbriimonas ginsengisoli]AIE87219.1 transcriptional regulator, AraC family protein [Fimbriimonas ginsengisoli Gsoil 348]
MRVETRATYEQCVREAVCHLATHLDEPMDLRVLADRAFLSPFHFHRIFRGMVGEAPGEFLRRLRMERAAWHLRVTKTPICEIALDAGFETPEAFTRAFRLAYSKSPSQFRSLATLRIELAAANRMHFDPDGSLPKFTPRDSGGRDMAVDILEVPQMRLGTIRHVGPYNQIGGAFERLAAIAGPAGLFSKPGAACLALYYEDPETTPATELQSDAAIVLPGDTPTLPGLIETVLHGGRFARFSHIGPYEHIGDAWAKFMGEWLPNSERRMRWDGTTFEIYINNPSSTPKEKLQTDLYVPVE